MANKPALKEILMRLSSEAEKDSYAKLDSSKMKQLTEAFATEQKASEESLKTMHETLMKTLDIVDKSSRLTAGGMKRLVESFEELSRGIEKSVGALGTSLAGSLEKSRPKDMSGFFKDFGVQLAQYAEASGRTSELISNLKWNASQQLRDTNGSPINPSIAPFGITVAYDQIELSDYVGTNAGTVTYLQAGNVMAVLSLSYDGSGNLIDVTRTA